MQSNARWVLDAHRTVAWLLRLYVVVDGILCVITSDVKRFERLQRVDRILQSNNQSAFVLHVYSLHCSAF